MNLRNPAAPAKEGEEAGTGAGGRPRHRPQTLSVEGARTRRRPTGRHPAGPTGPRATKKGRSPPSTRCNAPSPPAAPTRPHRAQQTSTTTTPTRHQGRNADHHHHHHARHRAGRARGPRRRPPTYSSVRVTENFRLYICVRRKELSTSNCSGSPHTPLIRFRECCPAISTLSHKVILHGSPATHLSNARNRALAGPSHP